MKLSHFAILALVAPIALAAQQPPAAPPANPITTAFRTRISALHRNIAQAFDSIPESKFAYKPTPAQLSIGFIAQHIASDDYFFCNNFGALKGTRAVEDTATADSVKATWPKAKLVSRLKDSFAFCDDAFSSTTDENAMQFVKQGPNELPRAAALFGLLAHNSEMYGIGTVYLRLKGIVPPSTERQNARRPSGR